MSQDNDIAGVDCKPGFNLPKTPSQWKEAKLFFHQAFFDFLNTNAKIDDLNECVQSIQNKVYDYFASTHGVIKEGSQSHFYDKYGDLSVNALKSCLKKLKLSQDENLEEIKFLSSLIRRKLKNSPTEFESKTIENNLHKDGYYLFQ